MRKIIKPFIPGGKLFLIFVVAAMGLGLINEIVKPVIIQNKYQEEREVLNVLFKQDNWQKIINENKGAVKAYYPVRQNERLIAYVLEIIGNGFGGEMKIIACFEPDGTIRRVLLLDNNETPGLGKKAELAPYMNKFIGRGGDMPIPVIIDMLMEWKDLDAVTGATITFMGIADALKAGSHFVKKLEMNND